MPAKCPKCGRTAADQRPRCMYCGTPIAAGSGASLPPQQTGAQALAAQPEEPAPPSRSVEVVTPEAMAHHQRAAEEARRALELDPSNTALLAARAGSLLVVGQGMVTAANRGESFEDGTPLLLEAGRTFERLAALLPPGTAYLQFASRAYALAGQFQHVQRLESMLRKPPATSEPSLELDDGASTIGGHELQQSLETAGSLARGGKLREAVQEYDRATQLDPSCVDAWMELGIGLATLGDVKAALDAFMTAVRLAPSQARAHDWCGVCLARSDRYEEALASFARALAIEPDNALALRHRGSSLVHLKQWDKAGDAFELASRAAPDMIECKYLLADVRVRQGRHDEAARLLRDFLAVAPESKARAASAARETLERIEVSRVRAEHAQDPIGRARALVSLGWHTHAIASCDEALASDPRSADAWRLRGVCRMHLGALQEALADLQRATELAPHSLEAWNELGLALLQTGNARRAFAMLSHAAELDPAHALTWSNRARALIALARHQEALESADRALKLDPGLPAALEHRGNALARLGRDAEALTCFKEAGRLEPRRAAHAANAARVLGRMGRLDQALPIAEHALRLAPRDALALEVQAELRALRKG